MKKIMFKKSSKAFTLAEVLIVIGIVGIVAQITIPSLVVSVEKSQNYAGLMKAYSTLTAAAAQIRSENNGSFANVATDSDPDTLAAPFQDKLKIQKACASTDTSCYNVGTVKALVGNTNYTDSSLIVTTGSKLVTSDGMVYSFSLGTTASCEGTLYLRLSAGENCGRVFVDINGEKPPNRLGKDVFRFSINKYNITPYVQFSGSVQQVSSSACYTTNSTLNGLTCAARAIEEGKIDYY